MAQTTQKRTDLISIIIPTYNMRDTIGRTIDSCLNQTVEAPVIVVDDGSKDGTSEFVKDNYPQVSLFRLNNNVGLSGAMNSVIPEVDSPFFIFTGADDILFPDNISNWIKYDLTDVNYCRWESFKPIEPEKILPNFYKVIYDRYKLSMVAHVHQLYTDDGRHLIDGVGCMCLRTLMVGKEKFDDSLRYKEGGELLLRLALMGYKFRYFDFNGGKKIGFRKSTHTIENREAIEYIKEKLYAFVISR